MKRKSSPQTEVSPAEPNLNPNPKSNSNPNHNPDSNSSIRPAEAALVPDQNTAALPAVPSAPGQPADNRSDASPAPAMVAEPARKKPRKRRRRWVFTRGGHNGEFPCLERVHLIGGLDPAARRELVINDTVVIPLDLREFLVMLVLAYYSFILAGRTEPLKYNGADLLTLGDYPDTRSNGGGYIPVKSLLKPLEKLRDRLEPEHAVFTNLLDVRVHGVVCRIRRLLFDLKLSWFMIDSPSNKRGYRLGVAPRNTTLTLIDRAGPNVWCAPDSGA